jgi:parallel beta-helix repeat protein
VATYYVKPASSGGSDAANGTSYGTAWATMQRAWTTIVAGDTVKVDAGTYTNGFRATSSGTVSNRITFEPFQGTGDYSDSGIIITGYSTLSGQLGPVWVLGQSYITVKGFNCTTGTGKGNFQASTGATGTWFINCRSYGGGNHWGVKVTDSDDCVTEGCMLEFSAGEHGIYYSGSNNGTIRGNTCHNNNWDGIHTNISDFAGQTVFNNSGHLIENNICYSNGLSGMDLTGMTNTTLRNNLVYNNANHAISMQNLSSNVDMPGCSGNVIVNNTLLSNGGSGRASIRFAATQAGTFSNDANTTCFNNILIGTAGAGSLEHFGGVSATFKSDFNIVVDVFRTTSSTDITFAAWKTATGEDANSLISTTAALFTNAATDDYTLKSTAPARDFGTSTFNSQSAATDDIVGATRDASPDAGAYEFVVVSSTTGVGGRLDEVALYDSVVGATQILSQYYLGAGIDFGSGGVVMSGGAVVGVVSNRTASGGAVVGGAASTAWVTSSTFSGGTVLGGTANAISGLFMSGGAVVGGSGVRQVVFSPLMTGGAVMGGQGVTTRVTNDTTTGGAIIGGSASMSWGAKFTASGGVNVAGTADTLSGFFMTGGVSTSGSASSQTSYGTTTVGGVIVGGVAVSQFTQRFTAQGSVNISGTAPATQTLVTIASGGTAVGGSANVAVSLPARGGAVLGGTGSPGMMPGHSGGVVIAGGHAILISYRPAGGALLGGQADVEHIQLIGEVLLTFDAVVVPCMSSGAVVVPYGTMEGAVSPSMSVGATVESAMGTDVSVVKSMDAGAAVQPMMESGASVNPSMSAEADVVPGS